MMELHHSSGGGGGGVSSGVGVGLESESDSKECVSMSPGPVLSGSVGGGGSGTAGAQQPPPPPPPPPPPGSVGRLNYSIPGVLHFLQHEWSRFEMERSQWEEERAELQTRVAFLQGERKGQENLKKDLVRRIKMLEYALKQERSKYARLKKGEEGEAGEDKAQMQLEEHTEDPALEDPLSASKILEASESNYVSNVNWRQGKQLLRQYLQEIGYTDTIIDVRANRVRSVLGLDVNRLQQQAPHNGRSGGILNNPEKEESVVMANFDFLSQEADEDEADASTPAVPPEEPKADTQNLPNTEAKDNTLEDNNRQKWNSAPSSNAAYGRFSARGVPAPLAANDSLKNPDRKLVGAHLELGELKELAVINDNESPHDLSTPKEALHKTWSAKYTLRSHYDSVRALRFHPTEPVLITASEDQTLKMWNLQKTMPVKKSTSFDVEPVYTFRAHRGPVLSLDVSKAGDLIFSGGLDASIRVWNMPSPDIDPYNLYDSSVLAASLHGHTDAVWGVAYQNTKQQLLSCSADGTVKLWSPSSKNPLLRTFGSENNGTPTSIDWMHQDPSCMITAYSNAACIIYDVETGKPVIKLDTQGKDIGAITRVACHPTLPMIVTAHDDRHIRFFDNYTGKLTHFMCAHLEAVTSIAIDVNGLYLISGSHDRSVRLWNLETKTCVQEITAHRKKFDESILDVAFHPSSSYIASAGADAMAKVFV
eukprot:TRINITY_DN2052_c0_g1_i1.p1 TRINITY_DN2052_c0_g1~~TRINITY_DN2052_c0_g1_i1.p1  ORF type:complete len:707 (-),score=206.30 TRINITY_DN2052_c0_g1_i1:2409-4529(-)